MNQTLLITLFMPRCDTISISDTTYSNDSEIGEGRNWSSILYKIGSVEAMIRDIHLIEVGYNFTLQ